MKLDTVRISTKGGAVTINESDFDADKHKLFVEKAVKKPAVKRKPRKSKPKE